MLDVGGSIQTERSESATAKVAQALSLGGIGKREAEKQQPWDVVFDAIRVSFTVGQGC